MNDEPEQGTGKAEARRKRERRQGGDRRQKNKGANGAERRVEGGERRATTQSTTSLDRRTIQKGSYIFREGELGEQAYIITRGKVEIVKATGTGEIVLGSVSKGGIFGEMALIDNSQRMASARAVGGPVEVMIITGKTFAARMQKMDPFTRALINIFADHIRNLSSTLSEAKTRAS